MSGGAAGGWHPRKQRALALAQPLTAYLELTYRCNWRCVFCYNPRHHDRRPLTLDEWSRLLDDLRRLGTLAVVLTGGEPLAHPEFLSIARAARDRRFALRVFTNGALVDEAAAAAIAELRPLCVELSLHGAGPSTHEAATRAPGSFLAVGRAVERLKRRGVPLLVKTLLTSSNEHELDAIIALAAAWGVRHQVDAVITPRDDGDASPLRWRASASAVALMYRRAGEQGTLPSATREEHGVNCGLGRITLAVDPEGEVYPCLQWRHTSLGNVRSRRLHELWHDSAQRQDAAAAAETANESLRRRGGALAAFPFCPALAAQLTGDPATPDEAAVQHAEIVARLREERRG